MQKIGSAKWTLQSAAGHVSPGRSDVVRCAPAATRGAVHPVPNSLHVLLDAVVRDHGVAAVEERGDVALICASSTPRVVRAHLIRAKDIEAGREQRGRGRPVYAIQQQIAALKTARTPRKHAYKPTFVRSNIF